MTRDETIKLLLESVAKFNFWRRENPSEFPNLTGADLSEANLYRANLYRANLRGANLSEADLSRADLSEANLSEANLSEADLSRANLTRANLSEANLSEANLTGANLTGANLTGANLSEANLTGANLYKAELRGAKGFNPYRSIPIMMLLDQPGPTRAYKLVNSWGEGPFNGGIVYRVGESYEVLDASTDVNEDCASGINVAMLDWCMREWVPGYRILLAEFTAAEIACIPLATDGKFRLKSCRIVGEVDLVKIGLLEPESVETDAAS